MGRMFSADDTIANDLYESVRWRIKGGDLTFAEVVRQVCLCLEMLARVAETGEVQDEQ